MKLRRYSVIAAIGNSARSFRALMEEPGGWKSDVAITRVLSRPFGTTELLKLTLADLLAAVPAKHPRLVELVDVARTDDNFFVITKYVSGCDLRAAAHGHSLQHALHVVTAACDALTHIHAQHLIHRHVAPRALLLSKTGDVKLRELGMAKFLAADDLSSVMNGFGYLSPEAAKGSETDHRIDVFGVGIVLWELLAARRLFVGKTDYETVELVRHASVPRIDGIDDRLDAIIRKALAQDVRARYQTAQELATALRHYAESRGVTISANASAELVRAAAVKRVTTDPRLLAHIRSEVAEMTSIIDDPHPTPTEWN